MIQFLIDECLSPKLVEVANRVVLPNVPRAAQISAYERALKAIAAVDLPLDMVNTVIDVDETEEVRIYPLP